MKRIILLFLTIITMETNAQDLKPTLEAVYKKYVEIVAARDAVKFKEAVSGFTYMNLKNQSVTVGQPFPDGFFEFAGFMLRNLNEFKFHSIISSPVAANAIYLDETDPREIGIFMMRFTLEGGAWKCGMPLMKGSPEITTAIKAGDFSFLKEAEYQPDKVLPSIPAEQLPSDYQGIIDVFGYGYLINVTINGTDQRAVEDKSSSSRITGGLKKGKNKIVIHSKPLEDAGKSSVTIKIRALVNEKEREAFNLDQKEMPPVIEKEFDL